MSDVLDDDDDSSSNMANPTMKNYRAVRPATVEESSSPHCRQQSQQSLPTPLPTEPFTEICTKVSGFLRQHSVYRCRWNMLLPFRLVLRREDCEQKQHCEVFQIILLEL